MNEQKETGLTFKTLAAGATCTIPNNLDIPDIPDNLKADNAARLAIGDMSWFSVIAKDPARNE